MTQLKPCRNMVATSVSVTVYLRIMSASNYPAPGSLPNPEISFTETSRPEHSQRLNRHHMPASTTSVMSDRLTRTDHQRLRLGSGTARCDPEQWKFLGNFVNIEYISATYIRTKRCLRLVMRLQRRSWLNRWWIGAVLCTQPGGRC
jgi:hypothetical protein